jgi:hypothetical protein
LDRRPVPVCRHLNGSSGPTETSGSTSAWRTDTARQGRRSDSGRRGRMIPRLSRVRIHPKLFAGVRTPRLTSQNGSEALALVRQNRLPKLRTRVRFLSPAPQPEGAGQGLLPRWARTGCQTIPVAIGVRRAPSGARRHGRVGGCRPRHARTGSVVRRICGTTRFTRGRSGSTGGALSQSRS